MKALIEVVGFEKKSGNKNGKDWAMTVCQCVIHEQQDDGSIVKKVGELVLPKTHAEVPIGLYEGEFGISVSADKKIGGRLLNLTPYRAKAVSVAGSIPKL